MIESSRSERDSIIPDGMDPVPYPDEIWKIHERISRSFSRQDAVFGKQDINVNVIDGFEDIFDEPLGAGYYYNTLPSTHQLAFALSLSRHPAVKDCIKNHELAASEIIKKFKETKVLSGIKALDLGCGGKPYFAVAASLMGAKMYTADVEEIDSKFKRYIERHILVNFNQPNAIEVLHDGTGGDFDIVSENIIGTVPDMQRYVKKPRKQRIIEIGAALLKKGGYLHSFHLNDLHTRILRKR